MSLSLTLFLSLVKEKLKIDRNSEISTTSFKISLLCPVSLATHTHTNTHTTHTHYHLSLPLTTAEQDENEQSV